MVTHIADSVKRWQLVLETLPILFRTCDTTLPVYLLSLPLKRQTDNAGNSVSHGTHSQPSIEEALMSSLSYDNKSKKWVELTNAVTYCIAKDMLPLYTVEKARFRKMLAAFDKRYKPSSRNYMSRVAISAAYSTTKEQVVRDLGQIEYYSATTDCWSSQGLKPYLSYTVHYVDSKWSLKSYCLQTMYFPEDHTASNLAEGLQETLQSWSLDITRQVCITTDSASNIIRTTKDLGWKQLSCCGHNLNLAVNKGLQDQRCSSTIGTCRKVVSAFSMSWKRRRDLTSTQATMDLPQHSLAADCVTRLGSTGKMVERIREHQESINVVLSNDKKASHLILNWQKKEVLKAIDTLLSPLKKMTDLSAKDYVTISTIKPMLEYICKDLLADDTNDSAFCLLVNIANFMEPRFKVDYLNDDEFDLVKEEITMGSSVTPHLNRKKCHDNSCTADEPPRKKPKKG
ncbi:E3 SUMO-protein ligase ZBED1-like [Dysidea avara]|uniref:E3 SUMO-protein ligase ZBED1-like n=1 Tax=Dysidea avara TaxID=196820 RepID=UPI003329FA58